MRLKFEWGSLVYEPTSWQGSFELANLTLLDLEPYVQEQDDTFDRTTLRFEAQSENMLTDGLLFEASINAKSEIRFETNFGVAHVIPSLLNAQTPTFITLDGYRYLEVAAISEEDWSTALSYATKPTSRTDALPRPAYEILTEYSRYDSESGRESIFEASLQHYVEDEFYRNAEDLRRAVNQQLYVTVPSVLATSNSFDITVAAFDINGFLVNNFSTMVELTVEGDAELVLPSELPFVLGYPSIITLAGEGLAMAPGYARIIAHDPTGTFADGAIPVRVEDAPTQRIFWGDMHTHSNLSDGDFGDIGPEEVYAFGRDVARLDFQALTDHDYRRPIPDWKWPLLTELAGQFYDPGRFVTLLAYEWSAEDKRFSDIISHKNVYFRDAQAPIFSAFDPRFNSPDKLWSALRSTPGVGNVFTIPHHSVRRIEVTDEDPWYGGAGTDWRFHDPELQPLIEIYSRWGSSESTDANNPRPVRSARDTGSATYALAQGYELGMMASGDIHDGTPGVSVLPARWSINAYPTGLVAVRASDLTREGIFDGLLDKQCYGTTGGRRILLQLETDTGVQIGQTASLTEAPTFLITAAGTSAFQEIALIRVADGQSTVIFQSASQSWIEHLGVTDATFATRSAYYLRVTQEDKEMGWIGPIFLEPLSL